MIAAERARQVKKFGAKHDDTEHRQGELVHAAVCVAESRENGDRFGLVHVSSSGVNVRYPEPWRGVERLRTGRSRIGRLAVAGALIAAEIDRLQRAGES